MQKRGSWVTYSTFWICWCFDDPRTQKLPLRSVPACAGVIQTGDLIPAGKANRRASENKQRKSSKAWLSRAGPGQPWAEHSPLFQPCLWKSAQIWAGSRAEIAPNSCYELNTMQRLRLAGEQKPNPGHWDIEGEEKKKRSNSAYKAQQSKWCRKVISLHLIGCYESGKPFFLPKYGDIVPTFLSLIKLTN